MLKSKESGALLRPLDNDEQTIRSPSIDKYRLSKSTKHLYVFYPKTDLKQKILTLQD